MKVVIIGAGYAGTMAANCLARKTRDVEITVVNPRPEFVERIRLHQRIAGTGTAYRPLRDMLRPQIRLVIDSVASIGDGSVRIDSGEELPFDTLVYAAGGGSCVGPAGTLAVGSPEQATEARSRLAELADGDRVCVVGGGLTGIETASEIAAARPELRVRLISDEELAPSVSVGARRRIVEVLEGLGIELVSGSWAADTTDELTLWAIANQVSDLAARSGLAVTGDGRMVVDDCLRSVTDPRIFAVGDGAGVAGSRMSCQTAMPLGAHAANGVARLARGEGPQPYSMGYTGQNVSLGRDNAVIQIGHRDDTATRFWFGGRPAAMVKERVCAGTVHAAKSGLMVWLPGKK